MIHLKMARGGDQSINKYLIFMFQILVEVDKVLVLFLQFTVPNQ